MNIQDYAKKYYTSAKAVSVLGLPPSFILAHSYLESGRGDSLLTKKGNNFFGIKALPKEPYISLKTKEVINGKLQTITDKFRIYQTPQEGFKAYLKLLSTNRYKNVLNASTHKQRAQELKKAGYFTAGAEYINTLTKIAKQFDQEIKNRPNLTVIAPLITIIILSAFLVRSNK